MKKNLITRGLITLGISAALASSIPALARGGHGGRGPQDTDGDGVISQSEFLAGAEQRFNRHDTDGDGVISLDEVTASATSHFEEMDADGNGVLSQEELRSHHRGPRGGGQDAQGPQE